MLQGFSLLNFKCVLMSFMKFSELPYFWKKGAHLSRCVSWTFCCCSYFIERFDIFILLAAFNLWFFSWFPSDPEKTRFNHVFFPPRCNPYWFCTQVCLSGVIFLMSFILRRSKGSDCEVLMIYAESTLKVFCPQQSTIALFWLSNLWKR